MVSERRKRFIVKTMIEWFESRDKYGDQKKYSLLLHENAEDMFRLICLLRDYDADIEHLQNWIKNNKKMAGEISPQEIREIQDFFKIMSIQES